MELIINEKEYGFIFGFGFIRELNKRYTEKSNGITFKAGLDNVLVNLFSGDSETLVEVLKVANMTETPKVSEANLVLYIEANGIDELFETVIDELKKSEFTKKKTIQMETKIKAEVNE